MRLLKSMMFWTTAAGLILGYFGLPVLIPATTTWTWFTPDGFYTSSILELGTLGFLVGLLFDLIRLNRRTSLPKVLFWFNSLAILALLVSVTQTYRLAASDASQNLSTVANCLAIDYGVSQALSQNASHVDLSALSGEMRAAGSMMSVVSRYYNRDRQQNNSLNNVSAGLTGAGIMLISGNQVQIQQAKQFIQHVADVFNNALRRTNGAYDNQTIQTVLNTISASEPTLFQQYYGVF